MFNDDIFNTWYFAFSFLLPIIRFFLVASRNLPFLCWFLFSRVFFSFNMRIILMPLLNLSFWALADICLFKILLQLDFSFLCKMFFFYYFLNASSSVCLTVGICLFTACIIAQNLHKFFKMQKNNNKQYKEKYVYGNNKKKLWKTKHPCAMISFIIIFFFLLLTLKFLCFLHKKGEIWFFSYFIILYNFSSSKSSTSRCV